MGDSDAISMSILLCGENESCLSDGDEFDDESVGFLCGVADFLEPEDEFIDFMVEKEGTFLESGARVAKSDEIWVKCARLEAIRWIQKVCDSQRKEYFNFGVETAYLSVTYMDRFLSKRSIDKGKGWAIQLLSISCFSLAVKMEECKIPPLSEFQGDDYRFTNDVIQRMELLVLDTLGWRLFSVTPFCYLNDFITKLGNKPRRQSSFGRAIDMILGIAEVLNTTEHRPSTIAAAAVLAASDHKFTRNTMGAKIESFTYCSTETDDIFNCYNIMLGLEIGSGRSPKFAISSDLTPTYSYPGAKRRKLSSDGYNHGSCIFDEKRAN